MSGPYAASATTYLTRGVGGPLPVPVGQKFPPPKGWTGYEAPYPSGADVTEWASNGHGIGNVCLRLVETVIGIDVDAYGSKPGAETLAAMEAELGPLPATWWSTSRTDGVSGIRLFRVPAGRVWADVVGPGVEIIHYGHRYVVVSPSVHPDTGSRYAWLYDGKGKPVISPFLDELPAWPEPWVSRFDRGPIEERSKKAAVTDESVSEAILSYPAGPPCRYLLSVLDSADADLAAAASRHDVCRGYVGRIVRAGEQGHVGAAPALATLQAAFIEALEHGEKRKPDFEEYERMVEGAVALVVEKPTAEADRGCCGSLDTGDELVFSPDLPEDVFSDFWSAREWLGHVRTFAQSRRVSPWSTLGVVLARCVVRVRHEIVLPPLVGSYASLNLFMALVGASGRGKGASERAAADAVDFGQKIDTATIGTGEGIAHLFAKREKHEVVRKRYAVLFSVPEIDMFSTLGARQGATLLPQLRSAWSGEALGFSNADESRTLPIEAHTYRLGLVMGVQPLRAEGLLRDSDGGTPQRFVWLPVSDRQAPDVRPVTPPAWKWEPPTDPFPIFNGLAEMQIPEIAREAIDAVTLSSLREEKAEALDGHLLLCQLKVAAAFALMDSRYEINDSDWSLAATLMHVSRRTRDGIEAALVREASSRNKARARAEGERAVIVSETVTEAQVKRVTGVVERRLGKLGRDEWLGVNELRKALASRDRAAFSEALEQLLEAGKAEEQETDKGTRVRLVK